MSKEDKIVACCICGFLAIIQLGLLYMIYHTHNPDYAVWISLVGMLLGLWLPDVGGSFRSDKH